MRLPLWIYIAAWLGFVYLFVQLLSFSVTNQNNLILSALYFVEYGVHELSHIVVAFLPSVFVAAAGSVGEISLTILVVIAAVKSRAMFTAVFGSLWMMLALHSVGRYMADARAMVLPLMGPGSNAQHDWHYVFGQLGLLPYDTAIGGVVFGIGTVVGIAGLCAGLFLIVWKHKARSAQHSKNTEGLGTVSIDLRLPDGRFVMQRRDSKAPTSPNLLGFFGGHIEIGETPLQAAQRELAEETSLPHDLSMVYIGSYSIPSPVDPLATQQFFLYHAGINNDAFNVYEGVGAETYTEHELTAREDLTYTARQLLTHFLNHTP